MRIEARAVDRDTGNTLFTRLFRDTDAARTWGDAWADEETLVKYKLINLD